MYTHPIWVPNLLRSTPGCYPRDTPTGATQLPPPPLFWCKQQESQQDDGPTGSWCLDKAVLVRNTCPENLPMPHQQHNSHNGALEHSV